MAGKLFPEILIGDSEDTFKKPPTAKNPFGTRRGVRLTSPLSADEESHQSNSLADSVEKKELQEMGEEEEEEEEGEPHQDVPGNIMEDGCSGLTIKDVSGDGVQRELWTPFTSNTEEQLESRMSELGSFSHSFELEGKTTPPFSRLEPPENSHEDSESYCLLDEDSILSDSAVSTGYFPCYRTYVELPRYQPPRNAGSPPGDAEGRAGSSCDVSVQCSGWLEEDSTHPGTRASDMMQGSRDQDEALACETIPNASSKGPLPDGNRLTTPGKEFEGRNDGDSSQQRPASEKQQECGPEVSENPKEPEATLATEAALLVEGHSPSGAVGKDSGQQPGAVPQSSPLSSKGQAPPLYPAAAINKSPPKKQPKQCRKEDVDVSRAELAPLLGPGRKRGALFPCGHSPEMGSCEIEASGSGQEGGSRKPSPSSRPSTSSTPAREAPRSTPSRLSLRSLVSWVRKIFRRSSAAKAQAGGSRGMEEDRGQPGSRLRWWIYRRRNRIYPH